VGFRAARSGNAAGLGLNGSQAWLDVVQTDTVNFVLGLPGQTDEKACYNNVPFDPNNVLYMPDPFQALADLFVRYKLRRLRLRYAPAVPTTDTTVFTVAWINDPNVTNTLYNTFKKVQGIQDSLTFPSYEPWAMEVAIDDAVLRYVDNDTSDNRFSIPGQLVSCINVGGATDVVTRKGTIFIEYSVDMFEMFNITGTSYECACGLVDTKENLRTRHALRRKAARDREAKAIKAYVDYFREEPHPGGPISIEHKQDGLSLTSFARPEPRVAVEQELQDLQPPVLRRADAFVVVQTPKQAAVAKSSLK
jgi:hypothetical protein